MTTPQGHGSTERIAQLRQRIAQAQGQLRREQRKQQRQAQAARARRLQAYGELVVWVLRTEADPTVVFGWLLDSATHFSDPTQRAHWQIRGTQVLAQEHRLQRTVQRLWEPPSHGTTDHSDMLMLPTTQDHAFPTAQSKSGRDHHET